MSDEEPMRARDYVEAALAAVRARADGRGVEGVVEELDRRGVAGDAKRTRETVHAAAAVGAWLAIRYADDTGRTVDAVLDELAVALHAPAPWETDEDIPEE